MCRDHCRLTARVNEGNHLLDERARHLDAVPNSSIYNEPLSPNSPTGQQEEKGEDDDAPHDV